eukprot:TRINITY_DN75085_c0_g1_i1.p1 TRINITY_DN75085_c0_g1~~TRINITY_DN75085_c0_g1_i1.p1  ORF type:complete len:322 (-),score=78.82 TRINITY_DN75085_c0_g1_i1:854-1819(-)
MVHVGKDALPAACGGLSADKCKVVRLGETLKSLASDGLWLEGLELLSASQKQKLRSDTVSFNICLKGCGVARAWAASLYVLDTLTCRLKATEFTCGNSLDALNKGSAWLKSLRVFSSMMATRMRRSTILLSRVLDACRCSSGSWTKALGLLAVIAAGGLLVDRVAFNTALSSLAAQPMAASAAWIRSTALLQGMARLGCQPSSVSCCALAGTAGELWQRAHAAIVKFAAVAVAVEIMTCNAAITSCERSGQWRMAAVHLEAAKLARKASDEVTYNAAISACEKASRWRVAIFLLQVMGATKVSASLIRPRCGLRRWIFLRH